MTRKAFPLLGAGALGCLGACLLLAFLPASTPTLARSIALPSALTICEVQGSGFSSPFAGAVSVVSGVVTADFDETGKHGFFIQVESCDSDNHTSDGLYVYLGAVKQQVVSVGDFVHVEGVVQEYYGKTELSSSPLSVTLLSSGNPLPAPVELDPPASLFSALYYFENLEGMRASLGEARVVGPTDSSGTSWVVRSDLGVGRIFNDDPQGTGQVVCLDDSGHHQLDPAVQWGDQVGGVSGVMDYAFGNYCLLLLDPPLITPTEISPPPPLAAPTDGALTLTLATVNLHNLFDTVDDPLKQDGVLSNPEYQRRLHKHALAIHDLLGEPDVVALQEAENLAVLQDLASQPELQADYGIAWQDGPDQRGLEVALFYRKDRLRLLAAYARQGCTPLVDGLGPDGNGDVRNPHNSQTCDSDGDGSLDGNRLFSRPPLVARLEYCAPDCATLASSAATPAPFYVIVNHWKSKTEDTLWNAYTLPRRMEQAAFVAALVSELRQAAPGEGMFVAGDLNDFPGSGPLTLLENAGLVDWINAVEKADRYTYNYQGVSQVLDHILMLPNPDWLLDEVQALHFNADFPAAIEKVGDVPNRASDHDPPLARFVQAGWQLHLPLVFR